MGDVIKDWGVSYHYFLQPVRDIHLHSHLRYEFLSPGNPLTLTLFTAVALFVLITAGLNFINLATARSANRAREVGLRKVVGAQRRQLIGPFLIESLIMSYSALLAWPASWLILNAWLRNFAYRTTVPLEILIASGGGALLLAQIPVSFQPIRSARTDPVRAIQYE